MKTTGLTGWTRLQGFILVAMVSCALAAPLTAQASDPFPFVDNFETEQGWGIFEEIVGGSSCYGAGIGEVARTTTVALDGSHSLGVWANKALSDRSNHVIAQKQLASTGQSGRFRYEVSALIAPETATWGEAGPEVSLQNTRELAPGQFRTATVGIQYRANPWSPLYRTWAVWAEVAPGQANWVTFTTTTAPVPGEWYTIAVEVDYTTNQYLGFWLQGSGLDLGLDLSGYHIAQEVKFTEQAFWLTLESENIYNNCGTAGNYAYQVYYDALSLRRLDEGGSTSAAGALLASTAGLAVSSGAGQGHLFLPLIRR